MPKKELMEISLAQRGEHYLVRFKGEFKGPDTGAYDADLARVVETIGKKPRDTVVSFEEATFIGSRIIGSVIRINAELTAKGKRLAVSGDPTRIKTVFSLAGLKQLLNIYKTEGQALMSFKLNP